MSRSEKLRYITITPFCYDVKLHVPELEKVLDALPDKGYLTTLKEYAVDDDRMLYKMVARFLAFSHTETIVLIQGFILAEKDGEDIVTEDGEDEVQALCNVLMVRAGSFREANKFAKAAELAFAVILAVEPEIPNVYDEGWTYQCILNEAFEFLTEMLEEIDDVESMEKLQEMATEYFENRNPDDCYYESQFEELLEVLKNRL